MSIRRCHCWAALLLLLCLAGTARAQAPARPGPLPALTEPAKSSATNHVLVWKDPTGQVIGREANPEAAKPLHLGESSAAGQAAEKPRGIGGQLLSMLVNLALVLGIAYLVMLGLKRIYQGNLRPARPAGTTPKRLLRVLESQALGQGRGIYLIAVGGRAYLIGLSNQQMTVLGEVSDDALVAEAVADDAAFVAPAPLQPFAHLLSRLLPTAPAAKAPDAGLEQRIAADPAGALLEQISEARQDRPREDAE